MSPPHCHIHFVCSHAPRSKTAPRTRSPRWAHAIPYTYSRFKTYPRSAAGHRPAVGRRSCSRRRLTAAPRVEREGARLPAPDTSDDEAGSLPRYRCQDGGRDEGDVPDWRERWQQDEQGAAVSGGRYSASFPASLWHWSRIASQGFEVFQSSIYKGLWIDLFNYLATSPLPELDTLLV